MHPRLTGVLRTIRPDIPSDIRPRDAWRMIKPEGAAFARNCFWQILQNRLPFANNNDRQVRVAEWIWEQRDRAQKAGRPWPPKPITVKPAVIPQPQP